jgi:heat shock protein HslJ
MSHFNLAGCRKLMSISAMTLLITCGWSRPGITTVSLLQIVPPPPTLEEMKSATYNGIDTTPIKLTDGRYEREPYIPGGVIRQRLELLEGQPAIGDLDGDGVNDAVAFLSEDDGGTAVVLHMAVMSRIKGKIVNIATIRLGERINIRAISVERGQITLDLLQFGPKDLPCCPSELVARVWTLERTGLVERVARKRQGALKLGTLEGEEWLFRGFTPRLTQPAGSGLSLSLEKERISGYAGCNRYMGTATATKVPGEVTLKATKSTNTLCGDRGMKDEEEYLDALRKTVKFGFFLGDLTLSWQKKDGSLGVMRFAPRRVAGP